MYYISYNELEGNNNVFGKLISFLISFIFVKLFI